MMEKMACKLFGRVVSPYIEYFDSLKLQLRQAKIKYSIEEYLSLMMFSTMIVFVAVMLLGSFFITVTTAYAVYSYTLSVVISFASAGGTFFIGYYYPSIKAKGIQNKINKTLPFTVIYMSTVASSEVNPTELFKIVSKKGGVIGKECERIYRDIHMLGMDVNTAITKAANRTPSKKFAELLWGMLSIIGRGGDLGEYLSEKSKEFMGEYRRSLKTYSDQISFYTEIYITLIIVGTLFFIVLSSIMSPLVGGDILLIQTFLVFFFIPMISIGFLFLLKSLSPQE
jgi:flagellar protein FlaJ